MALAYNQYFLFSDMKLTTDKFLEKIGSFGRYQIALAVLVNLGYAFWWSFPVMVMVFIASEPGWRCKNNVTCPFTETISIGHDNYKHRCDIPREDWEFVDDFTSIVTEVKRKTCSLKRHQKYVVLIVLRLMNPIQSRKESAPTGANVSMATLFRHVCLRKVGIFLSDLPFNSFFSSFWSHLMICSLLSQLCSVVIILIIHDIFIITTINLL